MRPKLEAMTSQAEVAGVHRVLDGYIIRARGRGGAWILKESTSGVGSGFVRKPESKESD